VGCAEARYYQPDVNALKRITTMSPLFVRPRGGQVVAEQLHVAIEDGAGEVLAAWFELGLAY
jgi:hypothetical protein